MTASVSQNSLQPGALMTVRALLSEYGVPVSHRAAVAATVPSSDSSRSATSRAPAAKCSLEVLDIFAEFETNLRLSASSS
jgi:hypothetical protein